MYHDDPVSEPHVEVTARNTRKLHNTTFSHQTSRASSALSCFSSVSRTMFFLFVAALAILFAVSRSTPSQPWGDWTGKSGLTVQTSNGPITGHAAPNASQVIEYLGIPFAEPPLGSLRFAPPVVYSGKAPYVASAWVSLASPSCHKRAEHSNTGV